MAASRFRQGGGRGGTVQHDDAERARGLAASGPGRLRRPHSDRPPRSPSPPAMTPKRPAKEPRVPIWPTRCFPSSRSETSSRPVLKRHDPWKNPGSLPPSAPGLPSSRTVTSGDRRCTLVTEPNLPARPQKNSRENLVLQSKPDSREKRPQRQIDTPPASSLPEPSLRTRPPENPDLRSGPHAGSVHKKGAGGEETATRQEAAIRECRREIPERSRGDKDACPQGSG